MKYTTKTAIKLALLFSIAIGGLAYWFMQGGTWGKFFFAFIMLSFVSRVANAGYHRWLTHNQFQASWIGRNMMLYFMVLSGEAPPGHYVIAHLNHHKYTDEDGDPHGPKQIGFWNLALGRYAETKPVFMRNYARHKDAQWVTEHYWRLYLANWILFAIINPYLNVWLACMFCWSWLQMINLNWRGHGGLKGKPTNLGRISNLFMGGEDYHKNHHENPGRLVMGKWDTTGKYLVPWLLAE